MGEEAKAQREFDRYKELEKEEADQIELRRREVGQFLFVLGDAQEAPSK
jgi:hypothetical protein